MLALIQTLIIQYISFDDKFFQYRCSPDTKLCSLIAVHTIANGNNGIKIVEQGGSFHIAIALILNYPNFSDSCFFLQFTSLVNLT